MKVSFCLVELTKVYIKSFQARRQIAYLDGCLLSGWAVMFLTVVRLSTFENLGAEETRHPPGRQGFRACASRVCANRYFDQGWLLAGIHCKPWTQEQVPRALSPQSGIAPRSTTKNCTSKGPSTSTGSASEGTNPQKLYRPAQKPSVSPP